MTSQDRLIATAQAEDTANLLDHISYTDIVKPRLLKEKENLQGLLTKSVLGQKVIQQTSAGPVFITSEQLAARAESFDYLIRLFEKILERGAKALEELQRESYSLHQG